MTIRTHGRSYYLRIPAEIMYAFGLEVGDILRVEIKAVRKKSERQNQAKGVEA